MGRRGGTSNWCVVMLIASALVFCDKSVPVALVLERLPGELEVENQVGAGS